MGNTARLLTWALSRALYLTARALSDRAALPMDRRVELHLAAKQHRVGPIILPARLAALETVLDVQRRVNTEAQRLGRPGLDILNGEEEARIRELIAAKTWPDRWTGDEPLATEPFEDRGQALLFGD